MSMSDDWIKTRIIDIYDTVKRIEKEVKEIKRKLG
jgi:hypothetical protein